METAKHSAKCNYTADTAFEVQNQRVLDFHSIRYNCFLLVSSFSLSLYYIVQTLIYAVRWHTNFVLNVNELYGL